MNAGQQRLAFLSKLYFEQPTPKKGRRSVNSDPARDIVNGPQCTKGQGQGLWGNTEDLSQPETDGAPRPESSLSPGKQDWDCSDHPRNQLMTDTNDAESAETHEVTQSIVELKSEMSSNPKFDVGLNYVISCNEKKLYVSGVILGPAMLATFVVLVVFVSGAVPH